jgi:Chaperone of endosialidase
LVNTTALGVFGGGFTTKAFTTPSDRRLKTDIRTSAYGLEAILQLRPKQYRYVDNTPYSLPDGVQEGFIAQELEEVLPNLVTDLVFPKSLDPDEMSTSGTETYKGINYTGLIPVLAKAIQELNDKVEEQSKEIEKLNQLLQEYISRK